MPKKNKIAYSTKLDPDLRELMRQHKRDSGLPETVMIDRALRAWLKDAMSTKRAKRS